MTIPAPPTPSKLSAADHRILLDDLTSGSFYWDPVADTVEWSAKLLKSLGHAADKAIQLKDIEDLLHPEDRKKHADILARSTATQERYSTDIRLRDTVGNYHLLRVYGTWIPRSGDGGSILAGFLIDFSDLAQSRRETERSEHLFQSFFDNVPAAVYIKDDKFRHLYGNQAAASLAGCSLDEFLSKPMHDLFDEETVANLEAIDRRVLEGHETVTWYGELKSGTGQERYVFDTKFPIHDPVTHETLLGGIGIDTTLQHRMEKALARSQKLEALGQLVGGIAHDFNNTLAVLKGNVELVALLDDEAEIDECMEECTRAIERGRRLTMQLLAFGRRAVLQPEIYNLSVIVSESDRMLQRILPENIVMETVFGGGLWNTLIDKSQVENAILNLALNARDAMESGGKLTIETANIRIEDDYLQERSEDIEPGRYVMLAVTDTGEGMAKDVAEKAFDPFFTTKTVDKGSGMGLAMVHGLMRQFGGSARLYTEPGVGTTVKLYFPASHGEVDTPQRMPHLPQAGKAHLLLTEDDDSVRTMLKRQLQVLGYRVTEASNGDMAFDLLLADSSIEMLVTDIVMPGTL
jgi:PAS domain S-box-containing protein